MKRITFKEFAGVKIPGEVDAFLDVDGDGIPSHIERASWLTAMVESGGKYGAVMSYDGTGITAGIHQAVAVFPRSLKETGTLWSLLREIMPVVDSAPPSTPAALRWRHLTGLFLHYGYELGIDGKLRSTLTGGEPDGSDLRFLLTGSADGCMPIRGSNRVRAEDFAMAFHQLFSTPGTFYAQSLWGMRHFDMWARRPLRFSKKYSDQTLETLVYHQSLLSSGILSEPLDEETDLALCMFWSHSVNAPGMALKVLCQALDAAYGSPSFARTLIKKLGNAKYGRWDDDLKNGRYQRTRLYALRIFPDRLFNGPDAIMPSDLVG